MKVQGGLNLDYTVYVWQETDTKQVYVQFCTTSTLERGVIMMEYNIIQIQLWSFPSQGVYQILLTPENRQMERTHNHKGKVG